jgi:ferrous iron transport protein B
VRQALIESRANLAEAGIPVPAIEAMSRYDWVGQLLEGTLTRTANARVSWSDRLDRVLTHRFIGTCFFAALMVFVFQSIFTWAGPLTGWIELGMGAFGGAVEGLMPEGLLRSLLVDGIIAGVGAVLVFLPQIAILFLFLAILEDCGYMARAAFLMDRLMVAVGLNGRAFIPLLSSFACAIPGIMATRVIENRRDRLTTILIAPLMSCSARLPVYFLLAAAFIPDTKLLGGWLGLQGITIAAMYFLGIFVAIAAAWIFRRFLFPGPTPPLVMELPAYKWPSLQVVLTRVSERAWSFIRRAGTMILAVTILVWAAVSFPKSPELDREIARPFNVQLAKLKLQQKQQVGSSEASRSWEQRIAALEANRDAAVQSAAMRYSVLGRMGRAIEPLVRPLGWDWRIGCAVIASFPAREVVIGAMGVIYKLGEGQDGASESLKGALKQAKWDGTNRLVFNIPVALSLMVFFSLCAQCAATLAVIRRETNSWRWPVFAFSYMTLLAYIAAWMTYQVGERCFS